MMPLAGRLDDIDWCKCREQHYWLLGEGDLLPGLDAVYNQCPCKDFITLSLREMFESRSDECERFILSVCTYSQHARWPLKLVSNALGGFVPSSNDEFCRKRWLGRLSPVHPERVESLGVARIFAKQARNP